MDCKKEQYPSEQTFVQPPPAYSAGASTSTSSSAPVDLNTGFSQNGAGGPPTDPATIESVYGTISGISLLKEADTIIVIDDSESMGLYGYWPLVKKCLSYLGPVVGHYDPNGITVYCLNGRGDSKDNMALGIAGQGWNDIKTAAQIEAIFDSAKPMGTTPIYDRLTHILIPYLNRVGTDPNNRPRPINILVVTDGVADDPEGVEELIGEVCAELDNAKAPNNQIGLQFIQIADLVVAEQHIRATTTNPQEIQTKINKARDDAECSTAWLKKLDDNLVGSEEVTRDIVDTKNATDINAEGGFNPKNIVKILVGALSKRHDRMK